MGTKLSCLLILLNSFALAQEWTFVKKIDLGQKITSVSAAANDKMYFGTERGNVYSLLSDGTEDTNYSSSIFQPITSLDGSNSLRVFVFYSGTGQFEFLDRFSALFRTYELTIFGINQGEKATIGVNQTLWFLSGTKLIQVDPVNQLVIREEILTDSIFTEQVSDLKFRRNHLAISNPSSGIYFYNTELSNANFLPCAGAQNFQFVDSNIILLCGEEINNWNPISGRISNYKAPRSDFEKMLTSGNYYHFTRGSEVFIYQRNP